MEAITSSIVVQAEMEVEIFSQAIIAAVIVIQVIYFLGTATIMGTCSIAIIIIIIIILAVEAIYLIVVIITTAIGMEIFSAIITAATIFLIPIAIITIMAITFSIITIIATATITVTITITYLAMEGVTIYSMGTIISIIKAIITISQIMETQPSSIISKPTYFRIDNFCNKFPPN